MSHEQLLQVDTSRAFEPTRRFEELSFFHIPFDQLNGDEKTESTVARLVDNGGHLALIGASGSGKSSVISSILGPFSEVLHDKVVPLRVPVAAEVDETVTEPGALARHIVRYVTRWASRERFSPAEQQEFEKGVAEVTRRLGNKKSREYHIALPLWIANVEVARQVESTGLEYEGKASGADAVEYLKRLVALFNSHELAPVFVFDDSDTWLRIPGLDRSHVANAFFMRNIRMMIKEIGAGVVVAVHDGYLEFEGYQEVRQLFTGEVRIPRLLHALQGVEVILSDRLVRTETQVRLEEIMDVDAVQGLASYYESDRTIRDVLQVTQRSMQHALSDGLEQITRPSVEQAVAEMAP